MMENMKECPSFSSCAAPICPFDQNALHEVRWFREEDICQGKKHNKYWIKNQRKIQSKTKSVDTYYTAEMLSHKCRIGKGMKGLDPDKDEDIELQKWFKKHPLKRILTAEERLEIGRRLTGSL